MRQTKLTLLCSGGVSIIDDIVISSENWLALVVSSAKHCNENTLDWRRRSKWPTGCKQANHSCLDVDKGRVVKAQIREPEDAGPGGGGPAYNREGAMKWCFWISTASSEHGPFFGIVRRTGSRY